MRKTQGPGRRPADRIVLRAGHAGPSRPTLSVSRPLRPTGALRRVVAKAAPRDGVTMDYQMGFTSGPSN
jgi:hypothetical protein